MAIPLRGTQRIPTKRSGGDPADLSPQEYCVRRQETTIYAASDRTGSKLFAAPANAALPAAPANVASAGFPGSRPARCRRPRRMAPGAGRAVFSARTVERLPNGAPVADLLDRGAVEVERSPGPVRGETGVLVESPRPMVVCQDPEHG